MRADQKGVPIVVSARPPITVVMEFDPEEMARRGRIGALRLHSLYDSTELTAPARRAFMSRFETEVDPNNELAADERKRRASYARRAHFTRLARLSAISRSKKTQREEVSADTAA